MLVAVVHFSVGAVAGAVFHVLVNRFVPDNAPLQIVLGALYGLLMWMVNFYVVIAWLQPRLVGQAYVLELMPAWVAALTHVDLRPDARHPAAARTLRALPADAREAARDAPDRSRCSCLAFATRVGRARRRVSSPRSRREGAQVYATLLRRLPRRERRRPGRRRRHADRSSRATSRRASSSSARRPAATLPTDAGSLRTSPRRVPHARCPMGAAPRARARGRSSRT